MPCRAWPTAPSQQYINPKQKPITIPVATVSTLPDLSSLLCKHDRSGDLTSPPFARADNCRLTFTPLPTTPARFANGLSPSKKSGVWRVTWRSYGMAEGS